MAEVGRYHFEVNVFPAQLPEGKRAALRRQSGHVVDNVAEPVGEIGAIGLCAMPRTDAIVVVRDLFGNLIIDRKKRCDNATDPHTEPADNQAIHQGEEQK